MDDDVEITFYRKYDAWMYDHRDEWMHCMSCDFLGHKQLNDRRHKCSSEHTEKKGVFLKFCNIFGVNHNMLTASKSKAGIPTYFPYFVTKEFYKNKTDLIITLFDVEDVEISFSETEIESLLAVFENYGAKRCHFTGPRRYSEYHIKRIEKKEESKRLSDKKQRKLSEKEKKGKEDIIGTGNGNNSEDDNEMDMGLNQSQLLDFLGNQSSDELESNEDENFDTNVNNNNITIVSGSGSGSINGSNTINSISISDNISGSGSGTSGNKTTSDSGCNNDEMEDWELALQEIRKRKEARKKEMIEVLGGEEMYEAFMKLGEKERKESRKRYKEERRKEILKREEENRKKEEEKKKREEKRREEERLENIKREKALVEGEIFERTKVIELNESMIRSSRRLRGYYVRMLDSKHIEEENLNKLVDLQKIEIQNKRREITEIYKKGIINDFMLAPDPEIQVLKDDLKKMEERLDKMYEDITLLRKTIASDTELVSKEDRYETNCLLQITAQEQSLEILHNILEALNQKN